VSLLSYGPDAPPVTTPTVVKYWKKLKALTPTRNQE